MKKSSHLGMLWFTCTIAAIVFASAIYLGKRERVHVQTPSHSALLEHRKAMSNVLLKNELQWDEALRHQVQEYFPLKEITTMGVKNVYLLNFHKNTGSQDEIRWDNEFGDQKIIIPQDKIQSVGEHFVTKEGIHCYLKADSRDVFSSQLFVLELDSSFLIPALRPILEKALLVDSKPVGVEDVAWINDGNQKPGRYQEIWTIPSHLGDWKLGYRYVHERRTFYHMPTLIGGAALSLLLLLSGLFAAWHLRTIQRRAAQQTSFVNRASHELRTPLTNLLLHSDLAKDALELGDVKNAGAHLQSMYEETQRLARIADNILTFASSSHGKAVVSQTQPIDPVQVLREVYDSFQPLWERKNITHSFTAPSSLRPFTAGDALHQMVANLCSNVEKYAGAGSHVRLEISERDAALEIVVSDNGTPISDSMAERIFLPFERSDNSLVHAVSGTGLGLAISRDLATQCGGSLTLRQSDGIKSFHLVIPYCS